MSGWPSRLVRLLPPPFRERFGPEILEDLEQDWAAARAVGRPAALRYMVTATLDLLGIAVAEHCRPSWRTAPRGGEGGIVRWLGNDWSQDLRHAVRALRRTPGFTLVAVGTLGLALGVNAGIFSIVDAVLLRPLPFPRPDRLVYIGGTAPGSDLRGEFQLAPEFLIQYREQSRLLEDVAPYDDFTNTLRVGDRAERVRMAVSTPSLFPILGVTPVLGRLPQAEDEDNVALLSHGLWESWFGGDTAVIGRAYYIGGKQRTVIGVMGPEFRFPVDGATLWITAPIRPEEIVPGQFGMGFVGRLRPGADMPALERELGALAQRLPERFGGSPAYADLIRRFHPVVRPLEQQLVGPVAGPIWILFGSVAVVLLIACANVGNLFLVRAERRQRELAVRRAIGAGRLPAVPGADHRGAARCGARRGARAGAGPAQRAAVSPVRPAQRAAHRRCRRGLGHPPLHLRGLRGHGAALRDPAGAPRVGAESRSSARRESRVHRAAALGARRIGGGADRARPGAPHRLGAPLAELRADAAGGPRLRHPRRLHLPDRARKRRAQGRGRPTPGSISRS